MKMIARYSLLTFLLMAGAAQAQLYKWVGPDGKVTYSDTPPPPTAKQVEQKSALGGGAGSVNLPFEVAEAAKAHPVTLYTTKDCAGCDQGRNLLTARGIPFSEKTVSTSDDLARLRQAGGSGQLPLLHVGSSKQEGFQGGGWNDLLTAAGYPQSSQLPRNYRQPASEPAAPVAAKPAAVKAEAKAKEAGNAARSADKLPPPVGNAPPGFRF
jgi:glutaredoxin